MKGAREVRLPESDRELREFLDSTSVGLQWVDADGRILWANRAALDLLGYSEPEYVGRRLGEFLGSETAEDLLARLAGEQSVLAHEAKAQTRDGSMKRVLFDGSGLFRHGRFIHARLVTRDLTGLMERAQDAQHQAEASSHLKDEFLALLSHELRAPLGAILLWLGLLRQGGFDVAARERALDIIQRSALSLERIVEDLLHASRIAAGGLMLHPQLVDLRSVVQVAADAAAGEAGVKGLALDWAPGAAPLWVKGDPGRLQQTVSNLLSNAIKFTPVGGSVKVSLDTLDGQARLCVSDTGEGMTAAFLPLAFERFRQQDSTSTRAHHGLGLGLYVVRHVVSDHGGFVSGDSPGPGRGSTFTVLLPLAASQRLEATSVVTGALASQEGRLLEGLRVLLVDDEEDAREALRLILQRNGMVVTTAASAREGFELFERARPDLLLSDVAMPGEDGLSFIRRVRLRAPGQGGLVPAAAVSGYAGASDRSRALLAGFQEHVPKPVDPATLLAVIARIVPGVPVRSE